MISPQRRHPEKPKSVDSTIYFVISHNQHPVFFVEMKPSGHIESNSARAEADTQMRERYEKLRDSVDIGKLYGMSAFGSKVCFYTYNRETGEICPGVIRNNEGGRLEDISPACRWGLDIMTPEGEDKFREIVAEIKAMCADV